MSRRIQAGHGPLATCQIALAATRTAVPRLWSILRPGSLELAGGTDEHTGATSELAEATTELAEGTSVPGEAFGASEETAQAALPAKGAPIPATGLLGWYTYAAASDPDALPYDLSFWRAAASVVGTALGTWCAARRSAAALPLFAATAAVSAGLSVVQTARHEAYVTRTWRSGSWHDVVFNRIMPVAHALSLPLALAAATSAAPTVARLVRGVPAELSPHWPLLRKLGLYYMVCSILGHWGEILFCTGIKYGLIRGDYDRENHMLWDQWLFPFPAEGSAAVLMALLLHPAKAALERRMALLATAGVVSQPFALALAVAGTFFLNQVVCTAIDYVTGLVANQHYELWDYRDMPFNFQGQICLQNSLFYTTLATWAVWRLFPRMERVMETASDTVLDGAFVGLGSFFLFLELLYHVLPPKPADEQDQEAASGSPGHDPQVADAMT